MRQGGGSVDFCQRVWYIPGMVPLLADTSYLSASPYGVWGLIMVLFLVAMLCYNAWLDDAAERRRGYYVLAAAFALGLLILFTLHVWQVSPMELTRSIFGYRRGFTQRSAYNALIFLLLGWLAASWGLGYTLDRLIHRSQDENEDGEEE